jgi:cellulose synthase/poly-beta-1,6-N-acetylglucosamine synthase-like glycosyltransferase
LVGRKPVQEAYPMSDVLFVPVLLCYVAILTVLFVYGLNFIYLTVVALRTGARHPQAGVPAEWPTVTIQLPIYNEMYVAGRLIDQVALMDYPRDRLEIQVLDDSTDETASIVATHVARWREGGLDIVHVRRADRVGYKAGALRHGAAISTSEFLAIFDADFLPQPDFLRRAIPTLLADPTLAFAQTRWGHVNRGYSLLTRLQALAIDGHFGIEQTGRWASGNWFNFNGTAGVWRRAALEAAGGWHDDTLTEDLDLSYRAFLAGWHAGYLSDVESPAELPVSMAAFRRQQHRWARGSLECAAKHIPTIWRSDQPLKNKVSATLHLTGYVIHLLLLALSLLYPLLVLVSGRHPQLFSLLGFLGIFNLTTLAPTLLFTIGQRQVGRRWLRQIPSVLLLSVFGSGLMVNTARAAWQAFTKQPAAFERTPKFGVRERNEHWLHLRYQLALDRIVFVELALAALNVTSCVLAVQRHFWAVAVYAAIFAAGLGGAALASIRQQMRGRAAPHESRVGAEAAVRTNMGAPVAPTIATRRMGS